MRHFSFSRLAVIGLHVIIVLSMLLTSLPGEARAVNRIDRMERIEEAATVDAPVTLPEIALSDPLEGPEPRPVYSLEELAAMQVEEPPVILSAEETAELLASYNLPEMESKAVDYGLALAGRGQVLPGDELLLAYQVQGTIDEGLELVVTAPQGVIWIGPAGSFDEQSGVLRLAVSERRGLLFWQVAESAKGPFKFGAALVNGKDGKELAQAILSLEEEGLTLLSEKGGVAGGLNQQVEVAFPAEASTEGLAVRVRKPLAHNMPPFALSGLAFEVTATGLDSLADQSKFAQALTITLHYDESQLVGDERFALLYYFNETFQDWAPLPSRVDIRNNTITAQSDHLTIFDVGVSDWQEARLPSLQPYQVAPFTGAAAFSLPLWTPPGPAGLAPSLELSYNSQVSDNLSVNSTQASWVGLGWSLEVGGSIERNMRGNPESLTDDTYAITAAGVASELAIGTDGKYHTTDESFWRIEYNTGMDSWTAWDRLGTKYIFGDTDGTRARYPYDIGNTCDDPEEGDDAIQIGLVHYGTWRWSLHKVINIYGQVLEYSYSEHSQGMKLPCSAPYQPGIPTDVAVYPLEIIYPQGDYRVRFVVEERTDYKSQWAQSEALVFYERYRLKEVQVLKGTQVIRRYQFNYATTPVLFPSHIWSAGGPALTLLSVQEYGADGASLPATTFTYDALHLTQVNNGYGGRVVFEYEAQPWHEAITQESLTGSGRTYLGIDNPYTYADNLCVKETILDPPNPPIIYYSSKMVGGDCMVDGYVGRMIVNGGAYLANTPARFLQPGSSYRTQVMIKRITTYPIEQAQVGMLSGGQIQIAQTSSVSNQVALDGYLTLPTNATQVNLYVYCSRKCEVLAPKLSWLAARYRVVKKSVYDGINATPQEFHYRYDEPATQPQTTPISPLTADPNLDYLDFRGHAATLEYGPDGRLNTTFFHQDSDLKGRNSVSIASQASFLDTFSTGMLNSSAWVGYNGGIPGVEYFKGDYALKLVGDATTRNVDRTTNAGGKAMLTQFMLSGESSSGAAGLFNGTPWNPDYRRWGVWFKADNSLVVNYTDDAGYSVVPLPLAEGGGSMTWQRDKWYVLLFIVDDDEPSQIWIWERDNPAVMGRYAHSMPGGLNWRARFASTNATLWLDTYTEGNFYNLSERRYAMQRWENASTYWPPIRWVYPTQESSYTFEGDGSWIGRRTAYAYGDYGNQTRQLEMAWNGTNWMDYRLSVTSYPANATPPKYLVGYPGTESVFRCPAGSLDGNCLDDTLYNDYLLQRRRNVYDGVVNAAPITGTLTAKRTLLRYAGANYSDSRFLDEVYDYDDYGNRTSTTIYNSEGDYYNLASANPRTSTVGYDPIYHTYVLTQTNPSGQSTIFTYNYAKGVPTSMTGPNGPDTKVVVTYDGFGRPLKILRPGDDYTWPTIQFTYSTYSPGNPFHIQLSQKMADGAYANFVRYYNGLGQVVQAHTVGAALETGTYNVVSDTMYDAYGQAVRQSVPYTATNGAGFQSIDPNRISSYTLYDPLGRTLAVTDTAGVGVHYVYKDLETRLKNGKGNTTRTLYDGWGRVTQVIPLNGDNDSSPAGPAISYFYDDMDRLTEVWQGTTISTTLTYDFAGRKIALNDPDMGVWTYVYDYLGNLKVQRDAKNQRTCLYYDDLNRLVGKHFRGDDSCPVQDPQNYMVDYIYDQGAYGIGQRTSMHDDTGMTTWSYDARGQLVEELRTLNNDLGTFRTQWGYNKAGLLTTMWYPEDDQGGVGEVVNYSYLPQMALNSMYAGSPPGNPIYTQSTLYDSAGRVTLRSLGENAVQTRFTYYAWNIADKGGKLQRIFSEKPAPNAITHQDLIYDYDKNGNITQILDYVSQDPQTQTPLTQDFQYDGLDRLTYAIGHYGGRGNYNPETYNYNSVTGNLSSKAGVAYTYSTTHKHAVTALSSGNAYQYDSNGNMIQRTVSGQSYNFGYDAENHLTAVSGAAQASFGYNGDGQRVVATEGITTTVFVGNYFEWQVASDGVVTTTEATKYYYAGGTRVAMQRGGEGVKYLLGDHLGSASVVLNADGTALGAQGYLPWGEVNFTEGTIDTEYTYSGQYSYVSSFGMAYFNARWFLPYLNRWAQPDSIIPDQYNPLDWDRYSFVRNNPTRYTDPDGHRPCDEERGCGEPVDEFQLTLGRVFEGEWDPEKQEEYQELIEKYTFFLKLLATILWEPTDWIATAGDCIEGDCSLLAILFAMAPFVPGSAGKYLDEIVGLLPSPSRTNFPWHHLLPQQKDLAENFAALGININEYMVSLPLDIHKKIHKGAGGGLWNDAWENFFKNNPNATKEDILKYIGVLIQEFGLDGLIRRVP